MDTVQVFTKNNNQWRAKELTDEDAAAFRSALERSEDRSPIAHDSYLINLASPDEVLWEKSIEAFRIELQRAERLGLVGVVAHPGAYVDSAEEAGLERIVQALDRVHRGPPRSHNATHCWRIPPARERTSAGDSSIWRPSSKASPSRNGWACASTRATCSPPAIRWARPTSMRRRSVRLHARWDCARQGVSRQRQQTRTRLARRSPRAHRPRQAGPRTVSPSAERPRFAKTPMYLETAKEEIDGEQMDAVNMRVLRGLIRAE